MAVEGLRGALECGGGGPGRETASQAGHVSVMKMGGGGRWAWPRHAPQNLGPALLWFSFLCLPWSQEQPLGESDERQESLPRRMHKFGGHCTPAPSVSLWSRTLTSGCLPLTRGCLQSLSVTPTPPSRPWLGPWPTPGAPSWVSPESQLVTEMGEGGWAPSGLRPAPEPSELNLGGVAGLPAGTLVARGDHLWAYPSFSPLPEPGQTRGGARSTLQGPAVLGHLGTMALSLCCHYLRAHYRVHRVLGQRGAGPGRPGQVQAREGGHLSPGQEGEGRGHGEGHREGTQGDRQVHSSQWPPPARP